MPILGKRLYTLVSVHVIIGVFIIFLKFIYVYSNKLIKIDIKAKNRSILKEIGIFSF